MYYGLKESFLVSADFMWNDRNSGTGILITKNTVLVIYAAVHNSGAEDQYSLTDGAYLFDMLESELEFFIKNQTLIASRCSSCSSSCDKDCDSDKKCCEPKNNDGRDKCYWCGKTTKKIDAGFSFYNYCEKCGK